MSSAPILFSFPDATTAEANRFAGSLAETLCDRDPTIRVERVRERPDTMDFGATLAVILAAPAITELAKGIASWLARNSGAKIEIRRGGEVLVSARDLDSADAPRIVEVLRNAGLGNG
jgi:hypothetical protein